MEFSLRRLGAQPVPRKKQTQVLQEKAEKSGVQVCNPIGRETRVREKSATDQYCAHSAQQYHGAAARSHRELSESAERHPPTSKLQVWKPVGSSSQGDDQLLRKFGNCRALWRRLRQHEYWASVFHQAFTSNNADDTAEKQVAPQVIACHVFRRPLKEAVSAQILFEWRSSNEDSRA